MRAGDLSDNSIVNSVWLIWTVFNYMQMSSDAMQLLPMVEKKQQFVTTNEKLKVINWEIKSNCKQLDTDNWFNRYLYQYFQLFSTKSVL